MIKRLLLSLGISTLLSILTVFILLFTNAINFLWVPLKRIRGTIDYEGESNGHENLVITENIITPAIFIICFIVVYVILQFRDNRQRANFKSNS
ncbi:MAG TPA: hypothetical protein VGH64_13115 [Puia sp.]|jgi:hypothetical protein